MSLIHDSLKKLESNASKDEELDSKFDNFKSNNGFNAKKLWMIIVAVVGIALIIYAYLMLNKYQKQNEDLLNDMKRLKSGDLISNNQVDSSEKSQKKTPETQQEPEQKLIIQQPVSLPKEVEKKSDESQSYASLTDSTFKNNNNTTNLNNDGNADFLLKDNKTKTEEKPIVNKKRTYKKKVPKKLTIKQTRQLVNNLQIQIDSANTQEVEKLLKQLSASSGKNSIVYLRMNAYWATKIKDDVTASSMYKKILFQKPQDIQANTNLALLEARNNKIELALNRLKALRKKYPTDKSIEKYLVRIESMNVK